MNEKVNAAAQMSRYPYGLNQTWSTNGLLSDRVVLGFKMINQDTLYSTAKELNVKYNSLWRDLTGQGLARSPAEKTSILYESLKNDHAQLLKSVGSTLKNNDEIQANIMQFFSAPTDSPRLQELRTILKESGLDQQQIMERAESNPEIVNALMTSPDPVLAFKLSHKHLDRLVDLRSIATVGEEKLEKLAASKELVENIDRMIGELDKKLEVARVAYETNNVTPTLEMPVL